MKWIFLLICVCLLAFFLYRTILPGGFQLNQTTQEREYLWSYDSSLSEEENQENLSRALKNSGALEMIEYSKPMDAPWIEFPDIPRFSIGWRMGGGESFMTEFRSWFSSLNAREKADFIIENPEPNEWRESDEISGFYDNLNGAPIKK